MSELQELAGTHLGHTDWQEMTQERVNLFADATDDHQYFRGGGEVLEVSEIPGGFQLKVRATIEVDGAGKPSLVADCLFRAYA